MTDSAFFTPPRDRDFGQRFDYAKWFGKTARVTLHRVPFTADYEHVVDFENHANLNAYLDTTPKIVLENYSLTKVNQNIRVHVPYDLAIQYNYVRVTNPEMPVEGSTGASLYYFINDVIFHSANSTELVIQMDVWQTFVYDVQWGRAFVEQGHIGVAQDSRTDPTGIKYLTNPEGLETGGDYQISSLGNGINFMSSKNAANYSIMIVSNTNLEIDGGTVDDPKLKTAGGSDWENLPNGANIYIVGSLATFKNVMENLSEKPWMTQGIMSITAVPTKVLKDRDNWPVVTVGGTQVWKPNGDSKLEAADVEAFSDWRNRAQADLPARYRFLKKFMTFPYLVVEVSTYAGEPMILKPELLNSDKMTFGVLVHLALPAPRVAFYPKNYNTSIESEYETGEFLNNAVYISNFPQFSVVNNGYLSAIASQAHGISQSYKSADWSQQRAMTSAQTSYDQASAGIGLANEMTGIGIDTTQAGMNLANQTQIMRSGVNMIGSVAGGAMRGGAAGAVGGVLTEGANAAININNNVQSANISMDAARRSNSAQTSNMAYNRDTNKSYADYAAKGDYQNTIAQINARVQDTKLTQPTASGGIGGDAFLMATHRLGVDVKLKRPPLGALERIGEYWLRYGYSVNRFCALPERLAVMDKFTYWKVKECSIISAKCPEPYKATLRGIMESGVTVVKRPEYIGRLDPAENYPIYKDYLGVQTV